MFDFFYEYYLDENWSQFDRTGAAIFEEEWRPVATTHERATAAHQAVGATLAAIVDDENPASAKFLHRYLKSIWLQRTMKPTGSSP